MHFFERFRKVFLIFAVVCITAAPSLALAEDARFSSLVIDADTGTVLHQENAGKQRYPASLTKMMTLYLTFQALDRGALTMNKMLRASSHAAGQKPSVIGLSAGQTISTRDAVNAVIIKSANDAAVVLAEAIGGSESQFASKMTKTAKSLGMAHTTFANASGLPDNRQVTTAYDLARLAIALRRDYPQYYSLFAQDSFSYGGHTIYSHNRVTRNYRGADGLKTGYIRASGFNLVTSAKRGSKSLVGVVMGGRSIKSRDATMIKLLDQAFSKKSGSVNNAKLETSDETASYDSKDEANEEMEGDSDEKPELAKNNPKAASQVATKNTKPAFKNTPVSSETSPEEKFSRTVVSSNDTTADAAPVGKTAASAPEAPKRDIFSPGIKTASNLTTDATSSEPKDFKPLRVRVNGKRVPVPILRPSADDRRLVKSNISPRGDRPSSLRFAEAQ